MGDSLLDRWRRPSARTRLPVVTLNARLRGIGGSTWEGSSVPDSFCLRGFGRLAACRCTTRLPLGHLRLVVARLACLWGICGLSLHDSLAFGGSTWEGSSVPDSFCLRGFLVASPGGHPRLGYGRCLCDHRQLPACSRALACVFTGVACVFTGTSLRVHGRCLRVHGFCLRVHRHWPVCSRILPACSRALPVCSRALACVFTGVACVITGTSLRVHRH